MRFGKWAAALAVALVGVAVAYGQPLTVYDAANRSTSPVSLCLPYHLAGGTAASTNSTAIKTTPGKLCQITPFNTTATVYYLKVYDSASAPTCSSATNLKHVYPIPASVTVGGFVIPTAFGESYSNGIAFCVTAGGGDTDNTSAATGVYIEASYQ
jgi:hypothetical protein